MIILDLETIGRDDAAEFVDDITAPSNYKDADKIQGYINEKRTEALAKAACNVDLCRIICCGWHHDEAEHTDWVTWAQTPAEERELLVEAWQVLAANYETHAFVTYGGLSFDWPILARRSQILGVHVPSWFSLDRYRSKLAAGDLAEVLTFKGALGYKRSLRTYCRLFGIPTEPEPFTGADIPRLYGEGRYDEIAAKNAVDLRLTAQLAEKLGVE